LRREHGCYSKLCKPSNTFSNVGAIFSSFHHHSRSIRNMQSQASNAKPIADVLEEVHRRQDATKQRADVRQTSLDLFNMSFAVV